MIGGRLVGIGGEVVSVQVGSEVNAYTVAVRKRRSFWEWRWPRFASMRHVANF